MKHMEVDRHFIKEKIDNGLIHMASGDQLVDVFTKGLATFRLQEITRKLGKEDIHSPAWGGVMIAEDYGVI